MNPINIEGEYLLPSVREVTLIGELDLDSPFVGGESLSELAEEVISKVGAQPASKRRFDLFPAALTIWFTSKARTGEDSSFWPSLPSWARQVELGPAFVDALVALEKPDFQDVLDHSNRFVQAAKIHGLVPPYAVERLVKLVRRAVHLGWDAGDLRNYMLGLSGVGAVSLKYLLKYAPAQGIDLLDRIAKSVRQPDVACDLLPTYVAASLLGSGAGSTTLGSVRSARPRVFLNTYDTPSLEVVFPSDEMDEWLLDGDGGQRDADEPSVVAAPPAPVTAVRGDENYPLIPAGLEALVFSDSGSYIKSGILPRTGGILVVARGMHTAPPAYARLGRLRGAWNTHEAFIVAGGEVRLLRADGSLATVISASTDSYVDVQTVARVRYRRTLPVYSSVPVCRVAAVRVVDNETGVAYDCSEGTPVIAADHSPGLALSLKGARLGAYFDVEGLVAPGMEFHAQVTTLLPGRSVDAELVLPNGWRGPTRVGVRHGEHPGIAVIDERGRQHELTIELPSLVWSVVDRRIERTPVTSETIIGRPDDLTFMDRLNLHHGEGAPPRVWACSSGGLFQELSPEYVGRREQHLPHTYDLRSLHGLAHTNANEVIEIWVRIAEEDLALLRLSPRVVVRRDKEKWTRVGQDDLAQALHYSDEEMAAARYENDEVEAARRRSRDRDLTANLLRWSRQL